jgi:hypothetical protein
MWEGLISKIEDGIVPIVLGILAPIVVALIKNARNWFINPTQPWRLAAGIAVAASLVTTGLVILIFRPSEAKVVMTPHRIGPSGEQTPEQINSQGRIERYFTGPNDNQVVEDSSDRLCVISRVEFHNGGGTCTLIHRGGHKPWEISVQDTAANECQVTCFDLTVSR